MGLISKMFGKGETPSEEYIEIDINKDVGKKAKIVVRPFVLKNFEDVNSILEVLREGWPGNGKILGDIAAKATGLGCEELHDIYPYRMSESFGISGKLFMVVR